MNFDRLDIRRRIVRLAHPGQTATVTGPFDQIEKEASSFGKSRKMQIRITQTDGGALIERLPDLPAARHAYPEIAALEPGQNVLLDVPPISHQRVRVTASQTALRLGTTYRCMREGDAIRVIRTDGMDPDANAALPIRATKYNLDRLTTEPKIVFEVERQERARLRSACSAKSAQTGWTIRCRLQDDGTMLVYRTDAGAPKAATTSTAAE